MVTDTDFKFENHVPWDSPDFKKPFKKFSVFNFTQGNVPPIFLGVKC